MNIEHDYKLEEYKSLRSSLVLWESRRFSLAAATTAFIGLVLGIYSREFSNTHWVLACSVILITISGSCILTWLSARFVVRFTTYLEVFHCSKWEMRSRKLDSSLPGLNTVFFIYYAGLTVVSFGVSVALSKGELNKYSIVTGLIALTIYLVSMLNLLLNSYPRSKLVKKWENILQGEALPRKSRNSDGVTATDS